MALQKTHTEIPSFVDLACVEFLTLRAETRPTVGLDGPGHANTGRMHCTALLTSGSQVGLSLHDDEEAAGVELAEWAKRVDEAKLAVLFPGAR